MAGKVGGGVLVWRVEELEGIDIDVVVVLTNRIFVVVALPVDDSAEEAVIVVEMVE